MVALFLSGLWPPDCGAQSHGRTVQKNEAWCILCLMPRMLADFHESVVVTFVIGHWIFHEKIGTNRLHAD